MSENTTVLFRRTEGIYTKVIKPYKLWHEVSEMSPALEIDGAYYRLLRTRQFYRKIQTRKIVVCKEDGQIEESEIITRKWISIYMYFTQFELNKENLSFDLKQGGKKRHEPLIESFATITEQLKSVLSKSEAQAMDFHLHYLKEVYRLSQSIVEEVEGLILCRKQLENLEGEKLSPMLVDQAINHFQNRNKFRSELEAILLEDDERARNTVIEILKNPKYKTAFSSKYVNDILKEMYGAKDATTRTLATVKRQKQLQGETFSTEKYIEELRNGASEKEVQLTIDLAMKKHWVLSPNYAFR